MSSAQNLALTSSSLACSSPHFHFVLVHGYKDGAWSWYKVRTLLEGSGFKVTCLDLRGSGVDPSSPLSIQSFEAYNEPLTNFFSAYSPTDHHEKVILVGHSAGGLSVTDISYKFGEKVHVAVYVAATMLKHGFCTEQDIEDGVPGILRSASDSQFSAATTDKKVDHYTSPPEDLILASMLERPGPPLDAILGAQFFGSEAENIPRVYIKTLQDHILKPQQQESMIRRWPPARVFTIDSDHNPRSSAPFLLTGLLVRAAQNDL